MRSLNIVDHFLMMMFIIIVVIIVIGVGGSPAPAPALPHQTKPMVHHKNIRLFEQLLSSNGYTLEQYSVPTLDQYIITVHHVVPKNFDQQQQRKRKPVIVQHGLIGSSNNFFINSPFVQHKYNGSCGDNFGFCLLATGRYDLWLPNSRGNGYSSAHQDPSITPANNNSYWKFSFDQMAEYDTPAVIDFVRNRTGSATVGFVGFSQGANVLMGMLALKPAYAQVIRPAILWAPPLYINHMTSIIAQLTPFTSMFNLVDGEFPLLETVESFINFAQYTTLGQQMCGVLFNMSMGATSHLNVSRLPEYFRYMPSSVSNLDISHFAQLYQNGGDFTRLDYGTQTANRRAYGTATVPLFPLENIPKHYTIVVMRGPTDAFVVEQDARRLLAKLRSLRLNLIDYQVPSDTWGHLDFIIGTDAGKLVYDKTIEYLNKFS